MTIEEDFLSKYIKCKICHQVLEEPVTLPCLKTVCSKHIIENKDKNSLYKCCFCKKDHQIDFRELPINDEIQELIKTRNKYVNIDAIDFGENNKLAKDSCILLETILKQAKTLSNDPANYIHEHFSILKNEIDQTKEEYIQKIEKKYEEIINQVIELEKECKFKARKKENDLGSLIQEIESKLNGWDQSLKALNFNKDTEWKSIRFEVAKEIRRIQDGIEKCKNDLLLSNDYEFVPKKIDSDNNFGDFNSRNVEIGKINAVLNNFSNLQSENSVYMCSKESCVIKDIPWVIEYRLKKKDNKDFLGYFVRPKCESDKLKEKPFKTKLNFRINQNETRKTNIKKESSLTYVYEESVGYGFSKFMSKEEIMDINNGFYDQGNDSILLEATVKIILN